MYAVYGQYTCILSFRLSIISSPVYVLISASIDKKNAHLAILYMVYELILTPNDNTITIFTFTSLNFSQKVCASISSLSVKKNYESQASALPVSGVFAHALELKGVNKQF